MDKVFSYCASAVKVVHLKPFQEKCIEILCSGGDVFLSYRIGSGKSICYECFPTASKLFHVVAFKTVVIVIEPLITIINEGVDRLRRLDFSVVTIGQENNNVDGVEQCLYIF